MFFATYNGESLKDGSCFVKGMTYIARYVSEEGGAVDTGSIEMLTGERFKTIRRDAESEFAFSDSAYAVVIRKFTMGKAVFDKGDIVLLSGVDIRSEDRVYYQVEGVGYFKSDSFKLLDILIVGPGTIVLDKSDEYWKAIFGIDDKMCFMTEGSTEFRAPNCFEMAVSPEGVVLLAPDFEASDLEKIGDRPLTAGRKYRVRRRVFKGNETLFYVEDDLGKVEAYFKYRFLT